MWIIDVAVLVVYFGIGIHLTQDAHQYLRDSKRTYWFPPLPEPEFFTPAGARPRLRAMRYWNYGGVAVILYYIVTSRWHF